ncbi:hypothetical protein [Microbulbifer sp. PSTR4-B]|uniref:hypothetical protein n=1 Tax=Microbulbifer sp. PSTR4-B TaxID=3243396 RepID=UPI00403A3107
MPGNMSQAEFRAFNVRLSQDFQRRIQTTYSQHGHSKQKSNIKGKCNYLIKKAYEQIKKQQTLTNDIKAQASDGWQPVNYKGKSANLARSMVTKVDFNPNATGAVMVGYSNNELKYYTSTSGTADKRGKDNKLLHKINDLRQALGFNIGKDTYCAEEVIMAENPDVRMIATSAYQIDRSGNLTLKIPCTRTENHGCSLYVLRCDIEAIDWSSLA